MTFIKRAFIIMISFILALAPVSTVYAGFNGTGDGEELNPATLEDVGILHLYHVNQGFRIYIVDEQGLAVTNSVDFVKYRPWEITQQSAFSQSSELMQKMWEDYYTRTGIRNIPKTTITYLGGVKTDRMYVKSLGGINKDGSAPTGNEVGVHYLTREEQEDSKKLDLRGFYGSPGKMYTITDLENMLRLYVSADYGRWNITGTQDRIEYADKFGLNAGEPIQTYNKIMAPIEYLTSSRKLVGTGDEMKGLMVMPLNQDDPTEVTILIHYLISMKMPAVNGIGQVINNGALEPIFKITNTRVKNKYNEVYQSATSEQERKKALITTMRELNLKVAFEPLSWAVPAMVSSKLTAIIPNKWGYAWTANNIVYGTASNVYSYALTQFYEDYSRVFKDSNIPDVYSDYRDYTQWLRDNDVRIAWQWSMPPRAYRTETDIPEYNMTAYDPDTIDGGDIASLSENLYSIGFGVMYFGVDATDMLFNGSSTSTNTWDKDTYSEESYRPGKSPQTTNDDGSFPNKYPSEGDSYKDKGTDHKFNIIKFYGEKQSDGRIVYTENHIRNNTVHSITIDDEVEYKVKGWFTSPEYREPSANNDSYDDYKNILQMGQSEGDKAGIVRVHAQSADTTLYVKLIKESDTVIDDIDRFLLHEDELSYPYSMSSIRDSLDTIWYTFPDKHSSGSGTHGSDDDEWSCSWERSLDDDNYHMTLKNGFDYGSTSFIGNEGIFAGSESGKVSTSDSDRSASINGFDTEQLIPNWLFTLYRDKSKDKVTLYPNKNSTEVTNNLSLIGIDSTSYIPSNRIATENGGNFKDTFRVGYFYESLDSTLKYKSSCSRHGSSGSYDGTASQSIDMFNSNYGTSNNIMTKYYLGKVNTGTQAADSSTAPFTYDGKTYRINCNVSQRSGVIKFYPMIKMKYQTQSVGETSVYVTAVNESTVLAPTRVETGFYRSLDGKPNLNLSSNQWSTHAKVHSYLNSANIADKNSVLPGGALYNLDTNAEGRETWLGIRCWQTVIPDDQLESLSDETGVKLRSQADIDWNNFKDTSRDVLEHYQVVQYVAPGIFKNISDFNKATGRALVSGVGQVSNFGGNTLDRSAKYYLKVDGTSTSRADIDILAEKEQVIVYKVLSDTEGNVIVLKDGIEIGRITKTQDISKLLEIPEIKALDNKTKSITNFVNAIDRNRGSDRNNQTWYNEGFDGIEVVYRQWGVQLGFGNGDTVRSCALDTKLTGKLNDRRDLYNFNTESLNEKTRTSMFQISARSTSSIASGKAPGYIGTIDGLDIRNNMATSMYSKLFYIPNANVTDLN